MALRPDVRIMGVGDVIEIYKEVGLPDACRGPLRPDAKCPARTASATPAWRPNSAVTTMGAHPFSTGADQCLVHNGSLSNHNNVRRELMRDGMTFETENDTEVAAAYLILARWRRARISARRWKRRSTDLDGFFTFVVGTKNGFGVVRDPIACKPAVMAETDRMSRSARNTARLPTCPASRTPRSGSRSRPTSISGSIERMHARLSIFADDARCVSSTRRCITLKDGTNETAWEVLNPEGQPRGGGRASTRRSPSMCAAASAITAAA